MALLWLRVFDDGIVNATQSPGSCYVCHVIPYGKV